MFPLPSWMKCPPPEPTILPADPVYRACVFNKMRLVVVGASFLIWIVALRVKISPAMARPLLLLLSLVAGGALVGLPLYGLSNRQQVPRPVTMAWVYLHSLSDLAIILLAIHFTGGLESPGNLLILTYLAGVAMIFPRRMVLFLATASVAGYTALGMGYTYGWWRAFYSDGTLQPIPSFRRALLIVLSDVAFFILLSGIVLYMRHLLEEANQQLLQERNYLTHLRDVVHEGLQRHEVRQLASFLIAHMKDMAHAHHASLTLWDETLQKHILLAATSPAEEVEASPSWQTALIRQARQQGAPVVIPNGAGEDQPPPLTSAEAPSGERSTLVIPLHREDRSFFGAVLLIRQRPFTAAEIHRVQEAAALLALVLLRALAEEHLHAENQLLAGLSQWASNLMHQRDTATLAQGIGEGARRLFAADRGILFILDTTEDALIPLYQYNIQEETAEDIRRYAQELPDCQALLHKEIPLIVLEDLSSEQHIPPTLQRLGCAHKAQAGVLVALQAPQGVQGILGLFWDHPFKPPPEHRFALRLVGAFGGAALYNARLMQHMQHQAYTDPLTGLPNRRAFEEALQRETYRAQRHGRPFVLMLLDLDDFKAINDTYGHLKGDQVLRETATALRRTLRESDFLARYGGDEFVALLPETTAEQAQKVSQKLHRRLASLTFRGLPEELRCSLSEGIAAFPQDGVDPQHLLALADQRMYAAKAQRKASSSATPES